MCGTIYIDAIQAACSFDRTEEYGGWEADDDEISVQVCRIQSDDPALNPDVCEHFLFRRLEQHALLPTSAATITRTLFGYI